MYGWWAVGFALASIVVYFVGLMCTHLSAFRCASNIRKTTSEHLLKLPLGYFDTHATGELRRIVDGCAASTETLLAHVPIRNHHRISIVFLDFTARTAGAHERIPTDMS